LVLAAGVETSQRILNRDDEKPFQMIRNPAPPALSYPQGHESCVMSTWTPSIVPRGDDETVYLVTDDLGKLGAVWREAEVETTGLETVIADLMSGQYSSPVRIVAFNTAERWARDVSEDVACEDPEALRPPTFQRALKPAELCRAARRPSPAACVAAGLAGVWRPNVVDDRRSELFRRVNAAVTDNSDAGPPALQPV
jgi:hypothetical protein